MTISSDGTKTIEKTIIILVDSRGGTEKPQQTGNASVDEELPLHWCKFRIRS
jgi:hypothetical protein